MTSAVVELVSDEDISEIEAIILAETDLEDTFISKQDQAKIKVLDNVKHS